MLLKLLQLSYHIGSRAGDHGCQQIQRLASGATKLRKGTQFMSEKHPECPLYNPLNCKEYYNPKLCAFVRKDKVCLKKRKPKTKAKAKAASG